MGEASGPGGVPDDDGGRRVALLVALATACCVLALVVVAVFVRAGWSGMEAACPRDDVGPPGWTSLDMSWTWSPPGFTCRWTTPGGEVARTSLWW